MKRISNLHVADCIDPASPLGGAVGLESVGCHCVLKLIEVDEDEGPCGEGGREQSLIRGVLAGWRSEASTLTWIFELPADDVVDEERLPDDFDFLHLLHRFGDEQQVGKQDTVDVHLRTKAFHTSPSQETRGAIGSAACSSERPLPDCLCLPSSSELPPGAAVGFPPERFLSWAPSGRSGCTPSGSEKEAAKVSRRLKERSLG